jgi:Spy/CpxP family protein refolding chaperone
MRKLAGTIAHACLRLALCAPLLFSAAHCVYAQDDDAAPPERESSAQPQGGGGLLRRLNLSPEQVSQIREIRRQHEAEGRELVRRINRARRALNEAIYADQSDEALVGERSRELAEAQAAATRLRAQVEWKVRRVLTNEQLARLREFRQQAQRDRRDQRLRRRDSRRQTPADAFEQTPNATDDETAPAPRRPLNRPRRRGILPRP